MTIGGASGPGGAPGTRVLGAAPASLADLLDELDQRLAGAVEVGAGLVAGELDLLLGDRCIRRDGR